MATEYDLTRACCRQGYYWEYCKRASAGHRYFSLMSLRRCMYLPKQFTNSFRPCRCYWS